MHMKIIPHLALLGSLTLLVMASSARATLITGTDPSFGANSLTIDTQTELAWLNLSFTQGLSYNQVLADMQPGGRFSGYTFASTQEAINLFADAGIGAPNIYSLSTPAIGTLISFVGSTGPINGYSGFIGISGTSDGSGGQEAPAIYASGINGTEYYIAYDGTDGTSYGDSTSTPDVGDWLVKTVPEPGIWSVAIAGLPALRLMRRRLKS